MADSIHRNGVFGLTDSAVGFLLFLVLVCDRPIVATSSSGFSSCCPSVSSSDESEAVGSP